MRQALAAARGEVEGAAPAGDPMPLAEAVVTLHYEFLELGIPPEVWTCWPLDAVELYWDERLRRDADLSDRLESHRRASAAAKVAPRIVFSVRVR